MSRVAFRHVVAVGLVWAAAAAGALAQGYPERPIRFVAPTTPGSPADLIARILADSMSKQLKQPIVVENKAGADQVIGLEFIARGAPADGYTAGVIGVDSQAILSLTPENLRFDPLRDLTLVAGLGESRYVLVGPASAPHRDFKELVAAARAVPGKFNYGASGPQVRIPTVVLMRELGLDMVYVPFKGGMSYVAAIAAGDIDWGVVSENTAGTAKPRVRLYAVTGRTRSEVNPDVPTFAELGFPQIFGPGYALAVRSGTPPAVIERLMNAAANAVATPEMKLRTQGMLLALNFENAEGALRDLNERLKSYREFARAGGLGAR